MGVRSSSVVLKAEGLCRQFGDKKAVDNVSFSLKEGEFLVLLGKNGSGKTTALNIFAGVDKPTSGQAEIMGVKPFNQSAKKIRGVVFQEHVLEGFYTGRETLLIHGILYGVEKKELEKQAHELLGFMEINDYADKLVKTYSLGMRRRLDISRALIHKPKLLLLDEPTINLDPSIKLKIWDYIAELKRKFNLSVLLVTQDIDEAVKMADRVIVFKDGKILPVLSKKEINKAGLEKLLGGNR